MMTVLIDGRQRMTPEEHEFWIERVVRYLDIGLALDPARAMADDDLDLWREYGDWAVSRRRNKSWAS